MPHVRIKFYLSKESLINSVQAVSPLSTHTVNDIVFFSAADLDLINVTFSVTPHPGHLQALLVVTGLQMTDVWFL